MRMKMPKLTLRKKIRYNVLSLRLKRYRFELRILKRINLWLHMRRVNKELLNGTLKLKPRGIINVTEKTGKK